MIGPDWWLEGSGGHSYCFEPEHGHGEDAVRLILLGLTQAGWMVTSTMTEDQADKVLVRAWIICHS
jgi:hypothetical protein